MSPVLSALPKEQKSMVERTRDIALGLGCTSVWVRSAGSHVILGMGEDEAFARLTPLGRRSVGLAFRGCDREASAPDESPHDESQWDPMLLVDDLTDVVEHALVAEGALPLQASGM